MWFQEMDLSQDFAWKMLSVLSGFQNWKKNQGYLSCGVNVPHSSALDKDTEAVFKQHGWERLSFGRNV